MVMYVTNMYVPILSENGFLLSLYTKWQVRFSSISRNSVYIGNEKHRFGFKSVARQILKYNMSD
jgi:hypothetical protein